MMKLKVERTGQLCTHCFNF